MVSRSCTSRARTSFAIASCRTSWTLMSAQTRSAMEPGYPLTSKRRRLPEEGSIEVFVADEQSSHRVDGTRWQKMAKRVLAVEGLRGDAELSLLFVDEAAMTELNKRFMGHDEPTDVLAFPLEDDLVGAGRWPDNGPTGPASNRV